MAKRTWNFVDKLFGEDELQSYIIQNAIFITCTEEIEVGKKVIYRCSQYRKYPEHDFQVKVIFSYDDGITVSTSNEYHHAHRASTTRVLLPVREISINSVAASLSCIQTRRAIEHQYKGVVSRSPLCSLLNYHRSRWFHADRLVTLPVMCSCQTNLKTRTQTCSWCFNSFRLIHYI
ncbi:unnamed protein product [Rotaria sordida]|uniref:Uncharacterized protein n=2 Tax=Rotaria sordida TaxID=392033 RepID=A0A819CMN9_9BILA|nr:unnamed protein product [Rotaria sordida]CAF3820575.1 unnamed protein product [Rotaria sordida]